MEGCNDMNSLLPVGIALFVGLMMTRLFKVMHLNFPDVTAFLLAGLVVGPYCLGKLGLNGVGFIKSEDIEHIRVISNVALGFIAFDIGNEFRMSQLKTFGKTALVIGVVQSVFATLVVDVVLIALYKVLGPEKLPLPVAITLGAIASATAPAATLMVVRQYKAKGPLTDLLLPIVALDDAVGLVLFAVSFGVAQAFIGGTLSVVSVLINPLLEIICSLFLGTIMGVCLTGLEKLFFSNSNRLSMTIAFVMLTITLANMKIQFTDELLVSFSPLLVCMMLGTIFCNFSEFSPDIMERSEQWTAPLYAAFFVISGAELDLGVFRFPSVIIIGLVYIISRSFGKYFGARASCKVMKCDENVTKYLGITLLPQAGVALGMVVTAEALGGEMSALIRNIILFSVLVYEIIGPLLTKMSLIKAGEVVPARSEKENRRRFKRRETI